MRRGVSLVVLSALALGGLAAGLLAPGGGATVVSPAKTHTGKASKVTRVTVVAKEFNFKLSKRKVPTGTVIFTVLNKGKIAHDFKINGKKTPLISPGKSARLTVKIAKNGRFTYICTVKGHARLGMLGSLTVGTPTADATSRVTVVATDFKFALSKRSVPTGIVVFTVKNKGKIGHDFKIGGKKTPLISPGKSARLIVRFTKKGRFTYVCTVPGHVRLGMLGTLAVGSTASPPPTTGTTTTTPPPPPTGTVGTANTTVKVDMYEYRFDLSQTSVPSGQVTFVITNRGEEVHNWDLIGVKPGKLLAPGQSETWTVGLPAKTYTGVCDVPFHVDRGMTIGFNVTP